MVPSDASDAACHSFGPSRPGLGVRHELSCIARELELSRDGPTTQDEDLPRPILEVLSTRTVHGYARSEYVDEALLRSVANKTEPPRTFAYQ